MNCRTFSPLRNELATTTLGSLITLFVIFFALVQVTYSISDIPTSILLGYSLYQKESIVTIIYFLLGIVISCFFVIQDIGYSMPYLLILVLSVLVISFYFFWFIKSISSENILNKIEKSTENSFKKITNIEKKIDGHFVKFQEFVKNNESYKFDLVYSGIFRDRYPTYSLEVCKEGFVKEIQFENIHECLRDLIKNENVKVIFEVEPTMLIPYKEIYLGIKNKRLLTIMFEPFDKHHFTLSDMVFLNQYPDIFRFEDFEKMTLDEQGEYAKSCIEKIFKNFTSKLSKYFEIESYKRWKVPSEKALNDFDRMIRYKIKNDQEINTHCEALKRIVDDQLLSIQPDVYLHLKLNTFRTIIEHVKSINEFAIARLNLDFFNSILKTFYPLLLMRIVVAKNPLIFDDAFETIAHFHASYITNTKVPYIGKVQNIVLHLRELSSFHQQLKEEMVAKNLTDFYDKVISGSINTTFWIIKRHIDWYKVDEISNHKYLRKQFQDLIKFLEFYREDPYEYFENQSDYYKIKYSLDRKENVNEQMRTKYELAHAKAKLVRKLQRELQEKVITLSIWMIYKFERGELPSKAIWDLALPTALSSTEDRRLDNSLTDLFNDYQWQDEVQGKLFEWDRIYPPGGHEVIEYDFNIFWVLLNIFKNSSGTSYFIPTNIKGGHLKDRLVKYINNLEPDFWYEALNLKKDKFIGTRDRYKSFVQNIKPSEAG